MFCVSLTAVHLQSDIRHVLRRPDDSSESTSTVLHSAANHHHLQVRRQSNTAKDLLPHLLGTSAHLLPVFCFHFAVVLFVIIIVVLLLITVIIGGHIVVMVVPFWHPVIV